MLIIRLTLLICIASTLSCTSATRSPSSEMRDDQRADRIQKIDLELSQFWNTDWKKNQELFHLDLQAREKNPSKVLLQTIKEENANTPLPEYIRGLMQEREYHVSQLGSKMQVRDWSGIGPWFESTFRSRNFVKEEVIDFKNWDEFELSKLDKMNPFPIEHNFYQGYSVRFNNFFPNEEADQPHFRQEKTDRAQKYLKARLQCDGNIIYPGGFLNLSERRSSNYEFNWYYTKQNGAQAVFQFEQSVNNCVFKFYDPDKDKTWTHGYKLSDLGRVSPEWIKLSSQIDICATPQGNFDNDITGFFFQQDYNFTTCPQSYDKLTNLRDPYVAMNEKIRSLTGADLPRTAWDRKDVDVQLNFDKAPRFEIIWVSSLNFSADFSGVVTGRALRYHAERGTQIRILVPQVTMMKKDRDLLERLQAGMPNIKVQYFKYSPFSPKKDGTWLDRFHRVNHMKILMGQSSVNPKDSFFITGGRNIRDSYLFFDIPIYKAYKYLKNYGDGEEAFVYYDDFEIKISGHEFVKSVMAQMISFWMRDPETQRFRSTNINIPKYAMPAQAARLKYLPNLQPLVRHTMSLPFFDGYQLERFYIDMLDTAKSEILLTTPYFRPSVAISAALDRAVRRRVKVKIVTRIHLAGDGTPQIAEDVNKQGINRHLKDVEIYEWTPHDSIMHAKILVIDGQFSFISSVNLNRRSFIHDTESGVMILHTPTALSMRQEVFGFLKKGRLITQKEKISWLNSTLIDWGDSYF